MPANVVIFSLFVARLVYLLKHKYQQTKLDHSALTSPD